MKKETYRIWREEEYSYPMAYGFLPKITAYLHEDGKARGGILVVPGGAYMAVSPTEGELVALKFYEMGYQTFVLTYTTNLLQMEPLKMQPLRDISRAVRYIRKKGEDFAIADGRIAVCGFSAGGHLSASLCVHFDDIKDEAPEYGGISNRPDAAILSYPVITSGAYAHRESIEVLLGKDASEKELEYMSLEKHVTEHTPPCFVWATETDESVPVENSFLFIEACRKHGVPCAFHMFSKGRHGLSLADEDWAEGRKQDPYTTEQIGCIIEKVKAGELTLPAGMQEKFSGGGDFPANIPDPEVAVWPILADAFLQSHM